MIDAVMLDSGPLGMIAHPRANPDIVVWAKGLLQSGTRVIMPEIIDYELRRKFLHRRTQFEKSLKRLDELKSEFEYLPLDTGAMLKAAELWADARIRGCPTADPKELDGDAILAAQALQVGAIVATDNIGHLGIWVDARRWQDIRV
ncbi:MAG: PIN domain-containing protein [Acidobacteriales bacterium]|nr:PIN domain-containing protein [Terriglobales bacterium]